MSNPVRDVKLGPKTRRALRGLPPEPEPVKGTRHLKRALIVLAIVEAILWAIQIRREVRSMCK